MDHLRLPRLGLVVTFGLMLAGSTVATAEDATAAPDTAVRANSDWPLERVVLSDGKTYQGLVESESSSTIEFVEVHRPRGKPMFLVVRPIDRKAIDTWERLPADGQQELRGRLEKYKQRALIEGRRMEDLTLSATRNDGQLRFEYQGSWFSLTSTADEPMTRRAIVRLEQIFTAYRQLLPPRWTASGKLQIRIFGGSDEYRQALGDAGLEIRNPAVFLTDRRLILAGSDMNRFDAELEQVNRQHRQIKQQLDTLVAETPARLKQLNEELRNNGIPAGDRQKILLGEQKKWEEQRKAARKKIAALDRKNSAKFNEVAGRMFTRLAHEAFHAYLETYVFPRQVYDMPRWLNEGLAQTFEAGLLESDTLRIDTPNWVALSQLQSDLRSAQPLALSELLTAGSDTFLSAHTAAGETASRYYYYSWGLAYYLAFERGVFGSTQFEAYLNPAAAGKPVVERFEKLVGEPLDEFQRHWREAMLDLKPSPPASPSQAPR
ncbi:MAG: DUF1570 domain-containing protein [Planctomycetia bacterium]|nr:DUF1570 domain-containing protein [Planctomycetia bacterium]